MPITILTGSTRNGRLSPRAARMVEHAFNKEVSAKATTVDLADFEIPFLAERLIYLSDPHPEIVRFSQIIQNSSALIVVSPEYNGGIPGVLKNALDHLNSEYENLLVGLVVVSAGPHGGSSALSTLNTFFSRVGARVIEPHLQINKIGETLDEQGRDTQNIYTDSLSAFVNAIQAVLNTSSTRSEDVKI